MRTLIFLLFCSTVWIPTWGQQYTFKHTSLPCLNKTFTIVVHVFPDSLGNLNMNESDVRKAVAEANAFFKPICAQFEVCEFRYHQNWQYDTLRRPQQEIAEITTKYNVERRINLYLVDSFSAPYPLCGLATLKGIQDPVSAFVLLSKRCISARAVARELGRFFGLLHTFEGNGDELVDGSNCTTAGDRICDTPADPYVLGEPLEAYVAPPCLFISNKRDAKGEYYTPDLGNIMSYYLCDTCGFTWEQISSYGAKLSGLGG